MLQGLRITERFCIRVSVWCPQISEKLFDDSSTKDPAIPFKTLLLKNVMTELTLLCFFK